MSIRKTGRSLIKWPLLNPDAGLLPVNKISWKEIEKSPGCYTFDGIEKALENARNIKRYALLRIEPEKPAWCQDTLKEYLALIDAVGKEYGGNPIIWGVDVVCPCGKEPCSGEAVSAIARAYCKGFGNAYKFVDAKGAFEKALAGEKIGLIVTEENVQEYAGKACDMPLRMAVDPQDEAAVDAAAQLGVYILESTNPALCNAASHAGHRFQMRSLEVDDTDIAQNKMTATIELANGGKTPCFTPARFYLRLSGSGVADVREYPMDVSAADFAPGEVKFVKVQVDTAGLTPGEYDIHVGLFCEGSGYPVSFGIDGRISDGYYEGLIILTLPSAE